jgi:hypothetical protein
MAELDPPLLDRSTTTGAVGVAVGPTRAACLPWPLFGLITVFIDG